MRKFMVNCSNYGKLILLVSVLVAAPILVVPFYPEDAKYIMAFLIPSIITFFLGVIICIATKSGKNDGNDSYWVQNGSVTVLFIWIFAFVVGAIPFVISHQLTFVQALFESVSGWTTTGLSVMDVAITRCLQGDFPQKQTVLGHITAWR